MRLGGIYALERISQESPRDYWAVMENLTAFVRERTQRTEAERTARPLDQRVAEQAYSLWENAGRPEGRSEEFWTQAVEQEKYGDPPAADIVAVLTVIKRRSEDRRELERELDFSGAVLRQANLMTARLQGASLIGTRLEGADLFGAQLERAFLSEARLEGANLFGARLERADLLWARLEGVSLEGARLEGANLLWAEGLTQRQLEEASGDAKTNLPEGLTRPAHWTTPERGAEPAA